MHAFAVYTVNQYADNQNALSASNNTDLWTGKRKAGAV